MDAMGNECTLHEKFLFIFGFLDLQLGFIDLIESVVASKIFFIFTLIPGEMIQID